MIKNINLIFFILGPVHLFTLHLSTISLTLSEILQHLTLKKNLFAQVQTSLQQDLNSSDNPQTILRRITILTDRAILFIRPKVNLSDKLAHLKTTLMKTRSSSRDLPHLLETTLFPIQGKTDLIFI